jgi:hypothetical protein
MFDSGYAAELFQKIQATGDPAAIDQLLNYSEPLIETLIHYRRADRHVPIDELMNAVRLKLWKSVRLFDPTRGTPYSFVVKITTSVMASAVSETWRRNDAFTRTDESIDCAMLCDAVITRETIADLVDRVRMVRTPCVDCYELFAQRWLVQSLVDADFALRRFQASDAMSAVYGLSFDRSPWIYDVTIISIRRLLLTDRGRLVPINPRSLLSTRSRALVNFAKFLSAEQFTKLAVIMRDVPPHLVWTIEPARVCAIRRGESEAVRANLDLILHGSPDDRQLFL